jgi:hypothetical protein
MVPSSCPGLYAHGIVIPTPTFCWIWNFVLKVLYPEEGHCPASRSMLCVSQWMGYLSNNLVEANWFLICVISTCNSRNWTPQYVFCQGQLRVDQKYDMPPQLSHNWKWYQHDGLSGKWGSGEAVQVHTVQWFTCYNVESILSAISTNSCFPSSQLM